MREALRETGLWMLDVMLFVWLVAVFIGSLVLIGCLICAGLSALFTRRPPPSNPPPNERGPGGL